MIIEIAKTMNEVSTWITIAGFVITISSVVWSVSSMHHKLDKRIFALEIYFREIKEKIEGKKS